MITGATPYHPNGPQGTPIYFHSDEVISSCLEPGPAIPHTSSTSFLYCLALLKDKVHQAHSMATSILLSPDPPESTAVAVTTMGTLIQEIVVTASTTMFACQQLAIRAPSSATNNVARLNHQGENGIADGAGRALVQSGGLPTVEDGTAATFYVNHHETLDRQWYGTDSRKICNADDGNSNINTHDGSPTDEGTVRDQLAQKIEINDDVIYSLGFASNNNQDIIELDAASLLAKYTHYCQVCGKGFKRDANRRMHMRAHGDEYKSSAALSSPPKNFTNTNGEIALLRPRKYSCPHEGCRWNKKHAKFQPLKSMICVKNHYKRSHCPKMYVCKRCNRKKFSVLSDLRSHEKHCGELRWQCSCGTSFSRKDKLMGHVALFVGHTPAINASTKTENIGG